MEGALGVHNSSVKITSRKGAKITGFCPNNQNPEFTVLTLYFVYFASSNYPLKLPVLLKEESYSSV
jgi:hypothetical protein